MTLEIMQDLRWVLAGLVDTALWHDRLYLTYCQQPANGAAGLFARSRQMLAVYDLALDQLVAPPRPLPALQAGAGTWPANRRFICTTCRFTPKG